MGWGIPHFMGEAMACNARLAKEFHKILVSYIFCVMLSVTGISSTTRSCVVTCTGGWRGLASARPELVVHGERFLMAALDDRDAYNRAYAAWVLGCDQGWGRQG